jgi:hypothetical protein
MKRKTTPSFEGVVFFGQTESHGEPEKMRMLKLVLARGVVTQVGAMDDQPWLARAKLKSEGSAQPTRGSAQRW